MYIFGNIMEVEQQSAFLSFLFTYILLRLAVTMALNVVICDVVILKGIYRKKQWTEKHGV